MQGATLSILGLYKWDNTIFSQMALPGNIDRDTLVTNILSECAELEIIYPDATIFKTILNSWSKSRLPVWNRIAKASAIEYNPLENYDRMEEWNDNGSRNNNSDSESTGTNKTRGYNQSAELLDTSGASGDASTHENEITTNKRTGRAHGNIGVTTSQQMLTQEIEISEKIDLYTYIITDFKNRFCIPVW